MSFSYHQGLLSMLQSLQDHYLLIVKIEI